MDGEEVIQLYVKDVKSKLVMPINSLKSFKRIPIRSGEVATITFELPVSELAYWNENIGAWEVEKGTFEIQLGASSLDIKVKKEVVIK